jgi:8-oxo-dGTP diphosphatase
VKQRLHRALLALYQRLPRWQRRSVVRLITPHYSVGAMAIIERADGALLLVRHSYRRRWGVPGGLLKRHEDPRTAVCREVREEVGIEVELVSEPAVVVDAEPHRVDLVFRARPAHVDIVAARPLSPEIVAAEWFAPESLPELQFETSNALVAVARSAGLPPVEARSNRLSPRAAERPPA